MKHAWLIGEGGIGHALRDALSAAGYRVTVLSRRRGIDLFDIKNIQAFLLSAERLPQLVINTCGILSDEMHTPEKSLQQLDSVWLFESIQVNVLITMNIAKVLSAYLSAHHHTQFCVFSARVSSISDNHKGGWYSYRMSKAMLNMLIKNIALEWKVKSPSSRIFCYHPGTVDTPLSKPFKQYLDKAHVFSPETAANHCLNVLFDEGIDKHGKLIDWQGLEIKP